MNDCASISYPLCYESVKGLDYPDSRWKAAAVSVFSCASPCGPRAAALCKASAEVLFKSYGIQHMVLSFAI